MDTKTKIIIILSALLIGSAILGYIYITKYLTEKRQKEDVTAILRQNEAAHADMEKQQADSIQHMAVLVQSLNSALTKANLRNGVLIAMNNDLLLQIDSLEASGTGVASSGKDSTGEYGKVTFSGTKGIATYGGNTTFYFNGATPKYEVDLRFSGIDVSSSFGRDENNVWRLTTISLTPGVRIKTASRIDSTIFIALRHLDEKPQVQPETPNFGLRLKANVGMGSTNLTEKNLRAIGWDLSAEVYYKYFNVTYYPATGVISGGLVVDFNIGSYIKKIF